MSRELLRDFMLEMVGTVDRKMVGGLILGLNFARTEPEYAIAFLTACERAFIKDGDGIPVPDSLTGGIREFVHAHPIEVPA